MLLPPRSRVARWPSESTPEAAPLIAFSYGRVMLELFLVCTSPRRQRVGGLGKWLTRHCPLIYPSAATEDGLYRTLWRIAPHISDLLFRQRTSLTTCSDCNVPR